jgi:ankyrin repeat protein
MDTVRFIAEKLPLTHSMVGPLRGACRRGHFHIVELLLDQGNYVSDAWLMSNACISGNMDIVNLLVSRGNKAWDEGMKGASTGGHLPLVKLMTARGAANRDECIIRAAGLGHVGVVQYLLGKGVATGAIKKAIRDAREDSHTHVLRCLGGAAPT